MNQIPQGWNNLQSVPVILDQQLSAGEKNFTLTKIHGLK
jgi:hypothetical protein